MLNRHVETARKVRVRRMHRKGAALFRARRRHSRYTDIPLLENTSTEPLYRRRKTDDFVFQLTRGEAESLQRSRSQNATLKRGANIKHLPYAFTEHGAIQAANVLSNDAAVEMGVHVVRAFVRLRQWLSTQKAFASKLDELESRVGQHDEQLAAIVEALRQLTVAAEPHHGRKMGFHQSHR